MTNRKHPLEMTDEEFDEYAHALAARWVAEDTEYDARTVQRPPWHIFKNVAAPSTGEGGDDA